MAELPVYFCKQIARADIKAAYRRNGLPFVNCTSFSDVSSESRSATSPALFVSCESLGRSKRILEGSLPTKVCQANILFLPLASYHIATFVAQLLVSMISPPS